MNNLYKTKNYGWALFVGHLVIEKLLKAYYTLKTNKDAPYIHNLLRIAELSQMEISDKKKQLLDVINTFNLNARYESEKQEFYKRCTTEYTNSRLREIKSLRVWIKERL